ncbi:MAG: phosphate:sodium symporter [Treponema sp.]|nr:MAG: phosphate:sodium symporter [Treponema sp.]
MSIFIKIFEMVGSLGLILYGMTLMSEGIQKSASARLHNTLKFMTKNRCLAALTGLLVTAIIQSSSATSVMTISFVNAGMLTLSQSIGVIFGANVGTTITAWIVTLIGFKFDIGLIAIPAFGVGYFLTFFKKLKKETLGEALMGFALLFLGLEILSGISPELRQADFGFLSVVAGHGFITAMSGLLFGLIITTILHSSSATTAIIITTALSGVIGWQFAATAVLGSNIGSTIDAVLASINSKLSARRVAAVHVLFNVFGSIIALIFLNPFMYLIDSIVPGGPSLSNIGTRIAIFHTMFNLINTIISLPFVKQIEYLVTKLIKQKPDSIDDDDVYTLNFKTSGVKENAEAYVMRAEAEIVKMSNVVRKMFDIIQLYFSEENTAKTSSKLMKKLLKKENYADQMHEEISAYLIQTSQLSLSDRSANNTRIMLGIVDDIENITDQIFELGIFINRSIEKKISLIDDDMKKLLVYIDKVDKFIQFIHDNLNKPIDSNQLVIAKEMEDSIDEMRLDLKRLARKRLEKGANVKAELLYIDMVRKLEKIGDYSFSISLALSKKA